MKKFSLFLFVLSMTICANAQQLIGALNLVSNKPINIGDRGYELLQANTGFNDFAISNNSGTTIQEAVDKAILNVPCGEFIMNAQIFSYDNFFIVVGDVWGKKRNSCLYQIGDRVSWGKNNVGVIVSIKDDDECIVKDSQSGKQKEMDFDDIFKVEKDYSFFKVGDKVSWKVIGGKYKTGVIVSIKDVDSCLVKDPETGKLKQMEFDDLFKVED